MRAQRHYGKHTDAKVDDFLGRESHWHIFLKPPTLLITMLKRDKKSFIFVCEGPNELYLSIDISKHLQFMIKSKNNQMCVWLQLHTFRSKDNLDSVQANLFTFTYQISRQIECKVTQHRQHKVFFIQLTQLQPENSKKGPFFRFRIFIVLFKPLRGVQSAGHVN